MTRLVLISTSAFFLASVALAQPSAPSLVLDKKIESSWVEAQRQLPGGVFHAPELMNQVRTIMRKFSKTGQIPKDIEIKIGLSGAEMINAWVVKDAMITEKNVYHITVTKGLIDLLSKSPVTVTRIGEERAQFLYERGEELLAAILAHEIRHIVNGDTEPEKNQNPTAREFLADKMGVLLLAAAGYEPAAMSHLLQALSWLSNGSSDVRKLIAKMMADHPSSPSRIAALEDLTATLNGSKSAKERLGFPADDVPRIANAPLKRNERTETAPKATSDRLEKDLKSPAYLALDTRGKLHYIENYFATRGKTDDPSTKSTIVGLIKELEKIASSNSDLAAVKSTLNSYKSFVGNLRTQTRDDSNDLASVGRSIRDFNNVIIARQLDLIQKEKGVTLNFGTIPVYATYIDGRYIYGQMVKWIEQANSVEEIKKIYYAAKDHAAEIQDKIPYPGDSTQNSNSTEVRAKLSSRMALRVLHLTKDVEKTMDFIFSIVDVQTTRTSLQTIFYGGEIFSALASEIIQNENLSYGDLLGRLNEQKTAIDRTMAAVIKASSASTTGNILKFLNLTPVDLRNGSPDLKYPTGRTLRVRNSLKTADIEFLYRLTTAGNESGFSLIANEIVKNSYTIPQVFDLLAQKSERWKSLASEITPRLDKKTGGEFATQLRTIALDLIRSGRAHHSLNPNGTFQISELANTPDPLLNDLYDLSLHASEFFLQQVRSLQNSVSQTTPIVFDKKAGEKSPIPAPTFSVENLRAIPADQRAHYIETSIQMDKVRSLSLDADALAKDLPLYSEAVEKLLSFNKITVGVKNEFEESVKELVAFAQTAKAGNSNATMPDAFWVLLRKVRSQLSLLMTPQIGISNTLTAGALERLYRAISVKQLAEAKSMPLVTTLMDNNSGALDRYLNEPNASTEAAVQFGSAEALARTYGKISGLAMAPGQEVQMIPEELVLIRAIYNRDGGGFLSDSKIPMNFESLLEESDIAKIMPLGPGFREVFHLLFSRGQVEKENEFNIKMESLVGDLWPFFLLRATKSQNPIEALIYTLAYMDQMFRSSGMAASSQNANRTLLALLNRSLLMVSDKEQMDRYATLFSLYLQGHKLDALDFKNMISDNPRDFVKATQLRYRERYYSRLAERLTEFKSWRGSPNSLNSWLSQRGVSFVKSWFKTLNYGWKAPQTGTLKAYFRNKLIALNTSLLRQQVKSGTAVDQVEFVKDIQKGNLLPSKVDDTIAQMVSEQRNRDAAVNLLPDIRSINRRDETYKEVLETHGTAKVGFFARMKLGYDFYMLGYKASKVWTREVLEQLKNAKSFSEAAMIAMNAWAAHAGRRAAEQGLNQEAAFKLLKDLSDARNKFEEPVTGEITQVFSEGTNHRNPYLEQYAKSVPTDFEGIRKIEAKKSTRVESPYRKLALAFYKLMEEYTQKLTAEERVHICLFLSGIRPSMPEELKDKLKKMVEGSRNRRKTMSEAEVRFNFNDLKLFFEQSHVDEKALAFRSMIHDGVFEYPAIQDSLIQPILFADPKMPKYLRGILNIFFKVANHSEKTKLLSWVLANSNGQPPRGPQIVALMIEKGGTMAAKIGQVVASFGFNLDPEYQRVLEKFKGKAQNVDKIEVMTWIKDRLAPEHFEQIKTVDQELGSGSIKIGYRVTLKDGRQVAIMLPRQYLIEQIAREFEMAEGMLREVMNDPYLRRDNLQAVRAEVERIIRTEMRILNEYKSMVTHGKNVAARPMLVKLIGNSVNVLVPQPIKGWSNELILVEEFIDSKSWNSLPDRAVLGWSKEKLARAAISEVLNQLLSYSDPGSLKNGKVLLDIDPHEENQLAEKRWFGLFGRMVNIDLGQSIEVDPSVMRTVTQMIAFLHLGEVDATIEKARELMNFRDERDVNTFRQILEAERKSGDDAFEVMNRTFEKADSQGVSLKTDYLFFMKLFATLSGLKSHIKNPSFMMNQVYRILAARALSDPRTAIDETKGNMAELKHIKLAKRTKNMSPQARCVDLFKSTHP
jgi:predicted unusual protein kinase regulating ubiquinone biosynthesis (AarF/ABC1/UbiB family)